MIFIHGFTEATMLAHTEIMLQPFVNLESIVGELRI